MLWCPSFPVRALEKWVRRPLACGKRERHRTYSPSLSRSHLSFVTMVVVSNRCVFFVNSPLIELLMNEIRDINCRSPVSTSPHYEIFLGSIDTTRPPPQPAFHLRADSSSPRHSPALTGGLGSFHVLPVLRRWNKRHTPAATPKLHSTAPT